MIGDTIGHKDGRYLMCKGNLGINFSVSWEANCIGVNGHHMVTPSEERFILLDDKLSIPVDGMTVRSHPNNGEDGAQ